MFHFTTTVQSSSVTAFLLDQVSVCLCTDTHEVNPELRRETGGSFALPIRIDDDCWIGANATILPDVTIGRGSTVASGAVVTRDVPEYRLVGGVPAKAIKKLRGKLVK